MTKSFSSTPFLSVCLHVCGTETIYVLAPLFLTLHLSGRSAGAHVSFPYQKLPSSLAIIKQISLKKASNNRSVYTTLSVSSRFVFDFRKHFCFSQTIFSKEQTDLGKKNRHEKAEVTYLPVWFCLLVVRKAHSKRKTPGRLQRSFRAAKI